MLFWNALVCLPSVHTADLLPTVYDLLSTDAGHGYGGEKRWWKEWWKQIRSSTAGAGSIVKQQHGQCAGRAKARPVYTDYIVKWILYDCGQLTYCTLWITTNLFCLWHFEVQKIVYDSSILRNHLCTLNIKYTNCTLLQKVSQVQPNTF